VAVVAAETRGISSLDFSAFEHTPLSSEPFPYVIVPEFVAAPARAALAADFPRIDQPGSFPVADLACGPAFRAFVAELEGETMRQACAQKFAIDLAGKPTLVTVRGHARPSDGRIHADAASKLVTVLIYMNEAWEAPGGRLRLLRRPDDLDSTVAEVPPAAGTLLAFRVTPNGWHGHKPAAGPRRVVQLNWLVSDSVARRERLRHGLTARIKRLFG
jgi:SM-20-related protein